MSEADSYIAKWLMREPSMDLARLFCAPSQRPLFSLWGALLDELDEAVFDLSEAHVSQAKLAWWGDELARGASGTPRHPLVREFMREPAAQAIAAQSWQQIVHAGLHDAWRDSIPVDSAALLAQHAPYAQAIAAVEAHLFDAAPAPQAVGVQHAMRRIQRALLHPDPNWRWPLQLLARHQASGADFQPVPQSAAALGVVRDLADDLLAALQRERGGAVFRRCSSALHAARLQQWRRGRFAAARPASPSTVWKLWRAARAAG